MVATIAGCLGAGAFGFLALLLVYSNERPKVGRRLLAVCAASVAFFVLQALFGHYTEELAGAPLALQLLELVRNLGWVAFFSTLFQGIENTTYLRRVRLLIGLLYLNLAFALISLLFPEVLAEAMGNSVAAVRRVFLALALLFTLGGMVLVEQIFRNTTRDSRWALKHLCFGAGFLFAFDFYLYANALLFNRIDFATWAARGFVNALAVPLIATSVARNRQWNLRIFVSRQVVFHTVTLFAAGVYLLAMAVVGWVLRLAGGEWGQALSIAFLSAAVLLLLSLFFSTQLRSRLRLFLAKHFYRNKYEYGDEWLKFTHALARTTLAPETLPLTILNAISDIVDCPGGILWRKGVHGGFTVAATQGMYEGLREEFPPGDPFIDDLRGAPVIWDLADEAALLMPQLARAPRWLSQLSQVTLLVPILHGRDLLAILVLAKPRSGHRVDAEDLNLLLTVARQAASYLALIEATEALGEARQFDAFNRLSAFLVHDLKNVVAQLSLIVSNSKRHGSNPAFVEDAFNTVADAVAKMNRMLASLRQRQTELGEQQTLRLYDLVEEAVRNKRAAQPAPHLGAAPTDVLVQGNRDRLLAVFEHLLQNAIEATPTDGTVEVGLEAGPRQVKVTIADNGCGMDRDFIDHRLFKPFETTKGKAGMGIGAYESRHIVEAMHGRLLVDSEPGRGSTFIIELPLASAQSERTAAGA